MLHRDAYISKRGRTRSFVIIPVSKIVILVQPQPNNGDDELIALHKKPNNGELWFQFQKVKYFYDVDSNRFKTRYYPLERPISEFTKSTGLATSAAIEKTADLYEKNEMIMELPEFKALFIERATAPFFVFQVFCVGLWCLDEYWYYSLFTLAMLVMFECTLVKQQLRNMTEIRNMGNSTRMILCYRLGKWIQLKTDELLPGDIVSLASNTVTG